VGTTSSYPAPSTPCFCIPSLRNEALGPYYVQQPALALVLADRVVQENLTVASIRKLVRNPKYPDNNQRLDREEEHNRRVDTTSVHDITILPSSETERLVLSSESHNLHPSHDINTSPYKDVTDHESTDLVLLERAAGILIAIASRADTLPMTPQAYSLVNQAEQALTALRLALVGRIADVEREDHLLT
jgi:hypothetical protein